MFVWQMTTVSSNTILEGETPVLCMASDSCLFSHTVIGEERQKQLKPSTRPSRMREFFHLCLTLYV